VEVEVVRVEEGNQPNGIFEPLVFENGVSHQILISQQPLWFIYLN